MLYLSKVEMSSPMHDDAFKQESSKLRAKSGSENLNTVEGQGSNQRPKLRSILKKSDQLNSNTRKLSVRFTLPLTIREENRLKLGLQINAAMHELLMIWATHYAHVMNRPSNYIDRVVFNFQPGMTANYLAYLLSFAKDPNISDYSKEDLAPNLHKDFDHFLETLHQRKKRTYIVDQFNVESEEIKSAFAKDSEPSIFIIQCSDPVQDNQIKSLIEICKRTKHSLIVFAEPIHGLHKYKLEVELNIKVRHLVLPRLIAKPKGHIGTKYDFYDSEYEIYHGIPLILENAKDYLHFYRMLEDMSLWLRPNYAPFIGYFFTLFNMEAAEIPFTRKTKLPSSKMTVFDVAAILGFNIEVQQQYNRVPIISEMDQPLILKAIKPLKSAFETTCHNFDTFTILHGEYLKQLYLEKAIARAMTNRHECRGKLGERWTFLSNSFFKNERAHLTLMPQVIPSVMRDGDSLDDYELYKWSRGNCSSAPQPTMLHSDWPLLFEDLIIRRTIIPADKNSQSPDCMFAFEDGMLCFHTKSSSQDLTIGELIEEIGKAPFLMLDAQKSVVRLSSEYEQVKISLVYLALSHSNIKSALLSGFANKCEKGTIDGITKDHGYIHVAYGNQVLPLPDQNVEVIVLLRAGIQSLIGWDGYATLVHPFTEINALRMLENDARL